MDHLAERARQLRILHAPAASRGSRVTRGRDGPGMTTAASFLPRISLPYVESTIGRKVVMAVTGLVLFGFVLGHFVGNLTLYLGPEAINGYSRFLHGFLHGGGVLAASAGMAAAAVLEVGSATSLTLEWWAARPVGYKRWQAKDSTYASRTMRWGGVILFDFIVFHLLHFTFG